MVSLIFSLFRRTRVFQHNWFFFFTYNGRKGCIVFNGQHFHPFDLARWLDEYVFRTPDRWQIVGLVYTQTNRMGSYLEVRPLLSSAILCLVLDYGLHHFANSFTESRGSAKSAPADLYVKHLFCTQNQLIHRVCRRREIVGIKMPVYVLGNGRVCMA